MEFTNNTVGRKLNKGESFSINIQTRHNDNFVYQGVTIKEANYNMRNMFRYKKSSILTKTIDIVDEFGCIVHND